jgi:hypothetical protein
MVFEGEANKDGISTYSDNKCGQRDVDCRNAGMVYDTILTTSIALILINGFRCIRKASRVVI